MELASVLADGPHRAIIHRAQRFDADVDDGLRPVGAVLDVGEEHDAQRQRRHLLPRGRVGDGQQHGEVGAGHLVEHRLAVRQQRPVQQERVRVQRRAQDDHCQRPRRQAQDARAQVVEVAGDDHDQRVRRVHRRLQQRQEVQAVPGHDLLARVFQQRAHQLTHVVHLAPGVRVPLEVRGQALTGQVVRPGEARRSQDAPDELRRQSGPDVDADGDEAFRDAPGADLHDVVDGEGGGVGQQRGDVVDGGVPLDVFGDVVDEVRQAQVVGQAPDGDAEVDAERQVAVVHVGKDAVERVGEALLEHGQRDAPAARVFQVDAGRPVMVVAERVVQEQAVEDLGGSRPDAQREPVHGERPPADDNVPVGEDAAAPGRLRVIRRRRHGRR